MILITKLHEMDVFPNRHSHWEKKTHIKRACIPFQIFSGMSYTWDEAHCLGFLDALVVDLLLLTAESRGQLGLTRTNPLGHLETPCCMAHQDYPTPSYTRCCTHTKSHWGHSLFPPVHGLDCLWRPQPTTLLLNTVR